MIRAEGRAAAIGEAAAARLARRVAERVSAEVPGVSAEVEAGRVVIAGRGLRVRLIGDAALRWIGGLVR